MTPVAMVSMVLCALIGAIAGGLIAPRLLGPRLDQRLAAASEAVAVLQRRYPSDYARLRAKAKAGPKTPTALRAAAEPVIVGLLRGQRAEMSDAVADQLIDLRIDEARAVRAKDPQACLSFFLDDAKAIDVDPLVGPALTAREAQVSARALEQVIAHPATPPRPLTEDSRRLLVAGALLTLPRETSRMAQPFIAFHLLPGDADQARALCDYEIALYAEALRGPSGTARSLMISS